jgi:hypothetical protein
MHNVHFKDQNLYISCRTCIFLKVVGWSPISVQPKGMGIWPPCDNRPSFNPASCRLAIILHAVEAKYTWKQLWSLSKWMRLYIPISKAAPGPYHVCIWRNWGACHAWGGTKLADARHWPHRWPPPGRSSNGTFRVAPPLRASLHPRTLEFTKPSQGERHLYSQSHSSVLCTLWWGLARKDTSFMLGPPLDPEFLFFFFFFTKPYHKHEWRKNKSVNTKVVVCEVLHSSTRSCSKMQSRFKS